MIQEIIAAVLAVGAAASGWIAAFKARGESRDALASSNAAEERARAAERATDVVKAQLGDANARAAAAEAEYRAADERAAGLLTQLERAQREKQEIYAAIAKAGVPVGGILVDDALARMYEDGDGGEAGARRGEGPDGGRDLPDVPGNAGGTSSKADAEH